METPGRIASLDGFRAISIFLVIISHLVVTHILSSAPIVEDFIIHAGRTGVQFFFVISGFLITYFLIREKEVTGRIDFKLFYTRRFLRITPAFFFYVIVLVACNRILSLNIPSSAFASALLYIHNFAPWELSWFLNHTWSLSVEEQFYLIWPPLFLFVFRHKKMWLWIAALALGSFMRSFYYKYTELSKYFLVDFFMYSDFLLSGCFMAFLFWYKRDLIVSFMQRKAATLYVFIAIGAILLLPPAQYHPVYDKIAVPTVGTIVNISICYTILYFIIRTGSIGYRLLNAPSVRFIGRMSYGLYIWQQFFIHPDGWWFHKFPLNLILLIVVATGSYYLIELPFLKLKDRFHTAQPDRPLP